MTDPQIPLRVPDGLTAKQLTDLCTNEHPNHRCLFQLDGRPYFWMAWCKVCENRRWINEGAPPPDIDSNYLAKVKAWATEAFTADEAKRTKRQQRRSDKAAMKK